MQGDSLSLDDLSLIGNETINRRTLSTTAWTIDSETSVTELIVEKDAVTSKISNEEGVSFLKFENNRNDVLRITKADDSVTITNREFSLNSDSEVQKSMCANTKIFIKPSEFQLIDSAVNTSMNQSNLFSMVHEIAFKTNKTALCW